MERTFDQLTSLRIVKRHQVEAFFSDRFRDLAFLSSSEEINNIVRIIDKSNLSESLDQKMKDQLLGKFSYFIKKHSLIKNQVGAIAIFTNNGSWITGDFQSTEIAFGGREESVPFFPAIGMLTKRAQPWIMDENMGTGLEVPFLVMGSKIIRQENAGEDTAWLLIKIPITPINEIMLNNDPRSGLGLSGETYLVGEDYLMRSVSRFIPNSILKTVVKTENSQAAVSGHEGSSITPDYRKIPVLSSFSKIKVHGLNWIILAEIDLKEAMIPIYQMRNRILFLGIFLSILFFAIVYAIALRITRPVVHLEAAANRIGTGDYNIHLPIETNDEIGSLTAAFNKMAVQVNEKTRELQFERIGRIRSVIDGEEIERQRLSRELHDGIGQSLIALKLRLESLIYMEPEKIKEQINTLKDQFDGTIDEIRRISNNLMPAVLEVFGITLAMKNLCTDTSSHSGINITFECHGELESTNTKLKTYIYRISQEAFANIVKHAAATKVSLLLTMENETVSLHIEDNGKGFIPAKAALEQGNGLYNMRERVTLLRGNFDLQSSIDGGTRIFINLPVF
ncbi:MAG: histidine kinase, partial [Bacteroidota bacterium]